MPELDAELVRKLADWQPGGLPVSSLYLDVDGKRWPRTQDYLQRAEELGRRLRDQAAGLGREAAKSVEADAARMLQHVEHVFERSGSTRGLALFSSDGAGLWEEIRVARPLRDRARVAEQPYVLPLEAILEVSRRVAAVVVDRGRARILVGHMGHIEVEREVTDPVPGRHKQGEWAQARYQRHVDDLATKHLKHVAEVLLDLHRQTPFDQVALAGPGEAPAALESLLHDYLRQRVAARWTLPMTVSSREVLERILALEEDLEVERERVALERVHAEAAAGRQAVLGLEPVLEALNDGRVAMLVAPIDLRCPGYRCRGCGRLGLADGVCPVCGAALEAVVDVLDAAVAVAYRQRTSMEAISYSRVRDDRAVGALLRY